MAKRRGRQEDEEWTKEDESVAQFVRFNCPTNSTLFHGNDVHYFSGSKAVETLFNSKYGTKAKEGEARFASRRSAEDFMQFMLERKMIWRAKKMVPKKKERIEKGEDVTKSPKMKEPKGKKEQKKEKEEEEEVEETDAEKKEEEKSDEKKKKVKLVEHDLQHFNDANDCYVWIYDPTPLYKKLIGILMIVGAIGCCCFPLWPPIVRQGVYYLSVTGISFFGVIIGVAILRTILFGLIWLLTGGEHKLWILPNLTEDVGFFESFKPWYSYERASEAEKKKKDDKKKKETKEKNTDDEGKKEEPEEKAVTKKESEESKDSSQASQSVSENSEDNSAESEIDEEQNEREETAAIPRKRRARKDDGDFVIVNK